MLFLTKWKKAEVIYIEDVLKEGYIITFEELKESFQANHLNYIEYFAVYNAIKRIMPIAFKDKGNLDRNSMLIKDLKYRFNYEEQN